MAEDDSIMNARYGITNLGSKDGFAMAATLGILTLLSILVVTVFANTMASFRAAMTDLAKTRSYYAAEASAESRMAQLALALEDAAGVRDTGGMNQRVLPFIIGLLLLPIGCGDSTGPKLASVDVSPATTTLAVIGGTVQFTAVGRDLNGNAIVSGGFVWSSSDPQVATVGESSGMATAVANGITMISAGSPSLLGQSGSATLTVAAP